MNDYYGLEWLVHIHQKEAQAFAARQRLAASLRPAYRPLEVRLHVALTQLRAGLRSLLPRRTQAATGLITRVERR
jgi:hypothetical protein